MLAVNACDVRPAAGNNAGVQAPNHPFVDWQRTTGKRPHPGKGCMMIERFEMILDRLATNRDAVRDDLSGLPQGERVAFDGVGRLRQLDIIMRPQVFQRVLCEWPQLIQPGLFGGNPSLKPQQFWVG